MSSSLLQQLLHCALLCAYLDPVSFHLVEVLTVYSYNFSHREMTL